MHPFDLSKDDRRKLWKEITHLLENYYSETAKYRVAPPLDRDAVRQIAGKYNFEIPLDAEEAVRHVFKGITTYGMQTAHPAYYGLFNPRPNFASILADMITATLNPQMAAWSHSPFAIETENYMVQQFGEKFGYPGDAVDGVFCGGGAEANHTALLCALNHALPDYPLKGLKDIAKPLTLYCSSESHHSIGKAAMLTGIGLESVRTVPVDASQQMNTDALKQQIQEDLQNGCQPFLVVATAGTTGSGAVDPLARIAGIAKQHNLWLHTDAAWGGAAILDPEIEQVLSGIGQSDSIIFDLHKWMSVPMGTSIFLTTHKEILFKTFRITAEYMPKEAEQLDITDPYIHSIQWSRRYIGLRAYLSLLVFGWKGYAETIHHQVETGNNLKSKLKENKWMVLNDTALPIACFTDKAHKHEEGFAQYICDQVVGSGKAWVSVYPLNGLKTLRACITNYSTTQKDIDELIALVHRFRKQYRDKNLANNTI